MRGKHTRFVGYARESSSAPAISEQIEALRRAGCHDDNIWTEPQSGRFSQLQLALIDARKGDVFVVPRLVCLSNSLKRLAHVLKELQSREIQFCVLDEAMDTRGEDGHFIIPALLHLIESRRSIKSEETRAGLAAARLRGRLGGRPAALAADSVALAHELLADRRYTVSEIAERVGVSRSTLYKNGVLRRRSAAKAPGSLMR